jgi:thymidylate synthase
VVIQTLSTLVDNNCHIWDGDCLPRTYVKKHKHAIRTEGDRSEIAIQLLETQLIYSKEEFINFIKTNDEFAKKWGELGPIYGKQWRRWSYQTNEWYDGKNHYDEESKTIDQIENSINLLKTDPDSRRNKVSAWNVGEMDQMTLPPCHTDFQFYTRELSLEERKNLYFKLNPEFRLVHENMDEQMDKHNIPTRAISLMWNQRSVDFTGLGFQQF